MVFLKFTQFHCSIEYNAVLIRRKYNYRTHSDYFSPLHPRRENKRSTTHPGTNCRLATLPLPQRSLFRAIEQDIIVSHQGVLSNETEGRIILLYPHPIPGYRHPPGCHRQQFGPGTRWHDNRLRHKPSNHCLYLGLGLHLWNNEER
ncbi:hypothetical protein CEXT_602241 [Caerostris extrusa]|uniref:Uncharacterized protein n=1 Tax=Caerostris extrusa TaxID=172846 RepID=A0AAV4MUB6_CAEEX|nr:hypothetical protein CEXT_602241 [Caerostris extrusa]